MDLSLLNQIKEGRSFINNIWIKHPKIEDEAFLESLNSKFLDLAVKRKIPLEKEAIFLANKSGKWTTANEVELTSLESYYKRLVENHGKVIDAQKKYLEDDIKSTSVKIFNLKNTKNKAIGRVAESWASKLSTERYILSLFYKDKALIKRCWDESEIELLEEGEFESGFKTYMQYRDAFQDEKIKDLAVSNFCQNLYGLSNGPFGFFGASVLDMTNIQQRFILLLEYYKNIIANIAGKVNDATLADWKELEKWAKSDEKSRDNLEKNWAAPSQPNNPLSFENLRKASMVEGETNSAKAMEKLLS